MKENEMRDHNPERWTLWQWLLLPLCLLLAAKDRYIEQEESR